MICPFRYVDNTPADSVTLHLFKSTNGTPRGDVRAPTYGQSDVQGDVCDMEACPPAALAFAAAIRMANGKNVDLVVSGDRSLWNAAWGRLMDVLPTVVLVVEDEVLVRLSIAGVMGDEGFTVMEAVNAREAIDLLIGNPTIRMMFTDVDMPPGMDGLGLAAAVRTRWPLVRIIVTSGHRTVETGDMPEGSRFFSKPYKHQAVIASMRELLAA